LLRYAQESSWREDNRRVSNGEQVSRVAALAMKRGKRSAWPGGGMGCVGLMVVSVVSGDLVWTVQITCGVCAIIPRLTNSGHSRVRLSTKEKPLDIVQGFAVRAVRDARQKLKPDSIELIIQTEPHYVRLQTDGKCAIKTRVRVAVGAEVHMEIFKLGCPI
jgi:hypothetical protein